MSYQRKCKYFSMEYVGNPGTVPACNRDAVLENFDCSNCADNQDNKKITNADRIRAMSDEELADFLHELTNWGCPEHGARSCVVRCGDCWLTWLREDVKEE